MSKDPQALVVKREELKALLDDTRGKRDGLTRLIDQITQQIKELESKLAE